MDDVERLLRDIYGEFDNQAIDRARSAVFVVVEQFIKYLRRDLWQELQNARNVDWVCGIGLPEECGISGRDHQKAQASADELMLRARIVRANPTSFSKYTVEFVNELYEHWELRNPREDLEDLIPF
jgi:hypothetical protein